MTLFTAVLFSGIVTLAAAHNASYTGQFDFYGGRNMHLGLGLLLTPSYATFGEVYVFIPACLYRPTSVCFCDCQQDDPKLWMDINF